jgi:hypothetical protein
VLADQIGGALGSHHFSGEETLSRLAAKKTGEVERGFQYRLINYVGI